MPAAEVQPKQLGIFKYLSQAKKWAYVVTQPDLEPGYLKCRVLTAGTYALLRDVFPPLIAFHKPASKYRQKLTHLVVHISDLGKGVDERTIAIVLNGRNVDAEYDPDWNHVLIADGKYWRRGKNNLRVRASDHAGNPSEKTFVFSLR